jgi:hypothetical protein
MVCMNKQRGEISLFAKKSPRDILPGNPGPLTAPDKVASPLSLFTQLVPHQVKVNMSILIEEEKLFTQ